MARELPLWRSMMFVPVIVQKFVDSAHKRPADAFILDLEDSVPAGEKTRARSLVRDAAVTVGKQGADVVVRINQPWRLAVRDLEASVCDAVSAIALPKVQDAGHVRGIAAILDELEQEQGLERGHTAIVPMVETADAFFEMREIARAHPRVVAMTLGAEDFALSAGMLPQPEGLLYPKQQMVLAARAAGILPLGFVASIAEYSDQDRFRAVIRQARRLGFRGGFCIHPLQVAIMNEEFAPSMEEVETARRLIAAYEEAVAAGRGAVEFEGKMVDEPIVVRARDTLNQAARMERTGDV